MDLERLLPEPPEGFRPFEPPESGSFPLRLYARWMAGFTGGIVGSWVADSASTPAYAAVVSIWLYETAAQARRYAKALPDASAWERLARPTGSITELPDGNLLLKWRRGDVHFASLARQTSAAIVGCNVAGDGSTDPLPLLERLHQDVQDKLPAPGTGRAVPLIIRHAIFGAICAALALAVAAVLGEISSVVGGASAVVLIVALLSWFLIWPRISIRRVMRKTVEQGDPRGVVRRALASRGIALA